MKEAYLSDWMVVILIFCTWPTNGTSYVSFARRTGEWVDVTLIRDLKGRGKAIQHHSSGDKTIQFDEDYDPVYFWPRAKELIARPFDLKITLGQMSWGGERAAFLHYDLPIWGRFDEFHQELVVVLKELTGGVPVRRLSRAPKATAPPRTGPARPMTFGVLTPFEERALAKWVEDRKHWPGPHAGPPPQPPPLPAAHALRLSKR